MRVNIVSETEHFKEKFSGMHSAFVNHAQLLKERGIDVTINSSQPTDITHLHSFGPYALFKLLTNTNTVVTTHTVPETLLGTVTGAKHYYWLIKSYLKFFYSQADLVIALNQKVRKELEALGIKTNIVTIANSLNINLFKKDSGLRQIGREKYGIKKNQFVVLGVGTQTPRKGFAEFIQFSKKFPELTFMWVGGKGMVLPKNRSADKNILDNLIMVGLVPYQEMPLYYNIADTLVSPSYQETFGMAILEAASCGLPLILRDLPEFQILFQNEYLACSKETDFLAAIKYLSENKVKYEEQVKHSLKLAKKFDPEKIINQLLQQYTKLIE